MQFERVMTPTKMPVHEKCEHGNYVGYCRDCRTRDEFSFKELIGLLLMCYGLIFVFGGIAVFALLVLINA